VWGLAFKPDTDDVRLAPAIRIIRHLRLEGAYVWAYDPQDMGKAQQEIPEMTCCHNVRETARGSDPIVLLSE